MGTNCRVQCTSQISQEDEEVNYGFSSSEELYPHEGSQDWDWSQDCLFKKKLVISYIVCVKTLKIIHVV